MIFDVAVQTAKTVKDKATGAVATSVDAVQNKFGQATEVAQDKLNQVTDYATRQAVAQLVSIVDTAAKEYAGNPSSKYPATLTASVSVASLVNLELQVTIPGKSENNSLVENVLPDQ